MPAQEQRGSAGGHRLQLQPHSPSTELPPQEQQGSLSTIHPLQDEADLLPGRAGVGAEAMQPLLGVLLCICIPCKMGNMSLWQSCKPCLCAYRKQLPAEAYVTAAAKAEAALPSTAKGIPGPSHRSEGQQGCPKPLCCRYAASQKHEFQSVGVTPGPEQFPDLDPLCSNTILHWQKPIRYAKISTRSTHTNKKALLCTQRCLCGHCKHKNKSFSFAKGT